MQNQTHWIWITQWKHYSSRYHCSTWCSIDTRYIWRSRYHRRTTQWYSGTCGITLLGESVFCLNWFFSAMVDRVIFSMWNPSQDNPIVCPFNRTETSLKSFRILNGEFENTRNIILGWVEESVRILAFFYFIFL